MFGFRKPKSDEDIIGFLETINKTKLQGDIHNVPIKMFEKRGIKDKHVLCQDDDKFFMVGDYKNLAMYSKSVKLAGLPKKFRKEALVRAAEEGRRSRDRIDEEQILNEIGELKHLAIPILLEIIDEKRIGHKLIEKKFKKHALYYPYFKERAREWLGKFSHIWR